MDGGEAEGGCGARRGTGGDGGRANKEMENVLNETAKIGAALRENSKPLF